VTRPCPDWRALTAHRHDPRAVEPAGWPEALAHLDGCPDCRRAALAADPTLLFQRLRSAPTPETQETPETPEIIAMRQAVAALRAARRIEPPRERAGWKHWAAAAVLATAALSLGSAPGLHHTTPAVGNLGSASRKPVAPPAAVPPSIPRFAAEQVPMVEELNRPAARVYQMDGGKNLSVVMIVDERLDV
jgi:hypothetical protein